MVRIFTHFLLLLAILLPPDADAGQVKLYLDNSRARYIMVDKQDCSIHKTKDGRITLGFKVGTLFFGIGPEITFGRKTGIDWDHTTQSLVARYQELCSRFNTGSLSKQEYDERLAKIETMEKEAYELHLAITREKAKQKQNMFDELDRETEKLESLRTSYGKINRKLETSLFEDEIERPILPKLLPTQIQQPIK